MANVIEQHLTYVNKGKKGSNDPEWIIVHFVGASGQALANARFFRSLYRGASAHYFVDPKHIVQVVEDDRSAWHVGDGSKTRKGSKNGYVHKGGATNTNSIGIEGCLVVVPGKSVFDWEFHPDTVEKIEWLVRQKQLEYGIDDAHVVRHFDVSGKACPGNWMQNNWAEWFAFKGRLAKDIVQKVSNPIKRDEGKLPDSHMYLVNEGDTLYGIAKKFNVSVDDLVKWNDLEDKNVIFPETKMFVNDPGADDELSDSELDKLAKDVLTGKYGSGEERKKKLGENYDEVQAVINRLMTKQPKPPVKKPTPKPKSITQLAQEVIDGKHGSGDVRKKALGKNYDAVQREVNRLLTSKTKRKSISELVEEVLAGKHGSGDARKKSLGSNYDAVQKEINRRFK